MKSPIGIFDSGIGGVTVLKEILKSLPNEHYIYYSDSLHNPYGDKEESEVLGYVYEIIDSLIEKDCKIIVFACNTATALAIDKVREKYPNIIFIGTEPAYKMVHDYASDKKALVMATPATIESKRFLNLYQSYNNGKTYLLGCPNLASWIENDESEKIDEFLNQKLASYTDVEVVVLGCTHYPLIQDKIQKRIKNKVLFYDSSKGVSNRLVQMYENFEHKKKEERKIEFYDSSNNPAKKERFFKLLTEKD